MRRTENGVVQGSAVTEVKPMLCALGKIPSGIFVITAVGHGGGGVGTLVSFVQQVSMEPLLIMLAVKKGRAIYEVLKPGSGNNSPKLFVLNIAATGDKALLKKYAQGEMIGAEAFAGVPHQFLASGQVVLKDASAYLECEVVKLVDLGADHDLIIGRPISGGLLGDPPRKPALHLRRDGSKY